MSESDLQGWLEGVLPGVTSEARARAWGFLEALWKVSYHEDALALAGCTWGDLYSCLRYPGFKSEYEAVKALLEIRRQSRRMDEADRRALDGWMEPHFGRGPGKDAGTEIVGHVRRFSDKLHELMIRSGDRARFSERVEHAISGAVLHFNIGAGLLTPPSPRTIEAESEDKAKT
jgi:hypothetical protein